MSKKEEIVIIGGGIMGVCTAFFLTRSKEFTAGQINVTLIEEGEIAGGASGQAAGFLAKDWHPSSTAPLAALSFDLHAQLAQEFNGKEQYGYRSVKAYSVDIKHPSRRAKHSTTQEEENKSDIAPPTRELPHEAHWLQIPPGQQQSQEGDVLSWLDRDAVDVLEQLGEEDTTAQLHPGLFVKTLWKECLAKGVKLVHGKVVESSGKGTITGIKIKTPQGQQETVTLDKLLIAAGPWTGALAKQLSLADIPVYELPGHSIIYRPSKPLQAEAMFARVLDKGVTTGPELFTRPDGTLYVAGQNTGGPLPPNGVVDTKQNPDDIDKLRKTMAILSPALRDGDIVKTQLCYRPVTKNGTPYLSKVTETDNVWVCAGSGPWGIEQGPGCGLVMSEMLMGRKTSADVSSLALS
ncbi:unnamed protein product [Sympodiomycopsis kandeliae]